ncbi:hypothetical protein HPB50_014934 [Hyalomma asiaticum]|uniref:Uncharacterized protein n=1 Tax=Hyalomma asiaticum TaxID=266040 RepID=A0ACB7SUN5_HYAAI|nr:hypothetical protein HPB50_014934 [Hyalomma asiaticum]
MAAQQAPWSTQQPTGWDAPQEDPYAAPYYEAYPGAPAPEAYPAPVVLIPEAYPVAVPEAPIADEYQRKRVDEIDSSSSSLYCLRVCTILIVLIVSGLIAFVMVGGAKWMKKEPMITTTATPAKRTSSSTPKTTVARSTHRESERTEPPTTEAPQDVIVVAGRHGFADHVSPYHQADNKLLSTTPTNS